MSLRNSSAFAKTTTKLRASPSSYQLTTDYATNCIEDLDESLVVEDLDLAGLEISSTSNGTSLSEQDEDIPGVVTEACVKNDLYILVKVPTNQKNYVRTTSTSSQTTPKSSRTKRNSSIFPIEEEEVEYSQTRTTICKPLIHKTSCWTKEAEKQEEFNSTTNFVNCGTQNILTKPNQGSSQQDDPVFTSNTGHPVPCQNQIEIQEINLDSVRSKDRSNVVLQNYGILITPTKMPKTDNLLVFQVDTEAEEESQKNSSSSCFQWFRKLFSRGHQQPGIVRAKVYKTYFVKWKKCPDNQCPCPRGVRSANPVVRSN